MSIVGIGSVRETISLSDEVTAIQTRHLFAVVEPNMAAATAVIIEYESGNAELDFRDRDDAVSRVNIALHTTSF